MRASWRREDRLVALATELAAAHGVDVVVRDGLRALENGRAVHISGRLYRFLVPILRTPPSRWLISALGVKL